MLGYIGYISLMGPGDSNLGGDAVLGPGDGTIGAGGVVEAIVGRKFSSIFCRVFMACNFLSPIVAGDSGDGFIRASIKSSTDWRTELAEDSFGDDQSCRNSSTVMIILY